MHDFELEGHPDNCQRLPLALIMSRCAMAPVMSTAFKMLAAGGDAFFRGRVGLARLPGSEVVQHPHTGACVRAGGHGLTRVPVLCTCMHG
jgi:hypothetical protein